MRTVRMKSGPKDAKCTRKLRERLWKTATHWSVYSKMRQQFSTVSHDYLHFTSCSGGTTFPIKQQTKALLAKDRLLYWYSDTLLVQGEMESLGFFIAAVGGVILDLVCLFSSVYINSQCSCNWVPKFILLPQVQLHVCHTCPEGGMCVRLWQHVFLLDEKCLMRGVSMINDVCVCLSVCPLWK